VPNRAKGESRFAPRMSHLSWKLGWVGRGRVHRVGEMGKGRMPRDRREGEIEETKSARCPNNSRARMKLTSSRWQTAKTPTGTRMPQMSERRAVLFVNRKCLQTFSRWQKGRGQFGFAQLASKGSITM
jgi:hypothetical protein